jgi:hypothetical protein
LVTFRLSVPRFQQLLRVVLAPNAPDDLANHVLMACTRPHGGIISVPLAADEAEAVAKLVDHAGSSFEERGADLHEQINVP